MANNPKIEVEVSADINKLKAAFSQAEASVQAYGERIESLRKKFDQSNGAIENLRNRVSQLKTNLEKATDIQSIAKYNIRLQEAQKELERLQNVGLRAGNAISQSVNRTVPAINNLTRATSGYNSIGIEFSRIIQDAPFGIIGIGNNIQQLAGNFQQLRNTSTSTGAALKTAFASIISPTNLLVLGISTLTSVLTVLSMKGFFKTKESVEDAEKALNDYRKSLDDVRKASLEGEISAQKEIQNFGLLKSQAENANIPLNKRIEAVNKLQKEYPEYLSSLTQEQILTGNVSGAYDRLTKSLLETAKARAASNIIIKNTEEVLTLQQQQIDNEQAIIAARDKVARLEASAQNSAVNALRINGQITAQNTDLVRAKEELNKLLEPQIERGNRVNELTTQNLRLNNEINTALENGATFTETTLQNVTNLKRTFEDVSKLTQSLTFAGLDRADFFARDFEAPIFAESGKAETQGIIIPDIATQFEEQSIKINELIGELSGAFTGLGSAIGRAFDNPGLGTFVGQFIAFAAKLVAANFTIASSNAIAGASSAALATGPAAPITLPAFIAGAVGVIGAAFGAIGAGNRSGVASGAGTSGVSQGTSFTGQGQGATGFNRELNLRGEFRIDGTDLVYVVDQARASQI
jgi:predicted  nucleic acid-binding Zn-ribbon protein